MATAERIGFEAALETSAQRPRRCVALQGIWSGRALYRTTAQARRQGAEYVEENAPHRIGISAPDAILRRSPRPASYIVVGILCDCSVFDGEEEAIGYCHNHLSGPLLAVTEAYRRRWPTAPERPR